MRYFRVSYFSFFSYNFTLCFVYVTISYVFSIIMQIGLFPGVIFYNFTEVKYKWMKIYLYSGKTAEEDCPWQKNEEICSILLGTKNII